MQHEQIECRLAHFQYFLLAVLLLSASGVSLAHGSGQPWAELTSAPTDSSVPPPLLPAKAGRAIENSISMKLMLIPVGEFSMGSPDSDSDADRDEKPKHTVRITTAFYLGATEVTQEQYQRVTGANPSRFNRAELPVENVSWEEALEFCRMLSALSAERAAGRVYRLPTEAEWEYACRAGTKTKWFFGDDESQLKDYAWYRENSGGRTHPVGQKKPNVWGLYDMHGNVSEWCSDFWRRQYAWTTVSDPTGPATGSFRVDRGGSWDFTASLCRSASRGGLRPSSRFSHLGFRVAFTSADQSGR